MTELSRRDLEAEDTLFLFEVRPDTLLNPNNEHDAFRLRSAYAQAWEVIHDTLNTDSSHWRDREDPFDKLLGLFSKICDLEDNPEIQQHLHFAYRGIYSNPNSNSTRSVLFDNIREGTYAVDLIREEIRQIASEASLSIPEDDVAQFTLQYASYLHHMRLECGENSVPNRFEVEMEYMTYLFNHLR